MAHQSPIGQATHFVPNLAKLSAECAINNTPKCAINGTQTYLTHTVSLSKYVLWQEDGRVALVEKAYYYLLNKR